MHYTMNIAGLNRDLPLCAVNEDLYIAAFIILGDSEMSEAAARELLKKAPEHDVMLTAEAKSIPLIHEMSRQEGHTRYIVARKASKIYITDPVTVTVRSITTAREQTLILDQPELDYMKGKKVLIVDDVVSTGDSARALSELVQMAGGEVVGIACVLAEGAAAERPDVVCLEKLPLFNAKGEVIED
ncbi:MAG: adenine phosphoribosyltransferase [Firmicutes bacterium]|nr:adenine phosphoribosyltransferase [Bacillota bacterium]